MEHFNKKMRESGLAVVAVLLIMLVLIAVGAFVILAVNRNTETRVAYQNQVAGFYAAEAGVNRAAGRVRNIFLDFNVPSGSDCEAREFEINGRRVRYQLTGCGSSPVTRTLPTGDPFEGLNAIVYTYDLRSEARNQLGYTEAVVRLRFESRLIPMFQFAAFYKEDLELTVGPPMVINGRLHTNKDMYLNHGSCDLRILGNLTIVGDLYRGRKDNDSNYGKIRIARPGGSLLTLGVTGPGDESCPGSGGRRRRVPSEEIGLWRGRIDTNVRDLTLPGQDDLLCAPWSCPVGQSPGNYWQRADLRIVLDLESGKQSWLGSGPPLWSVRVYGPGGEEDQVKTQILWELMRAVPGVVTYTDVPREDAAWDCGAPGNSNCESEVYSRQDKYDPAFAGCPGYVRGPRDAITASNYCNDYRYGGFYNWRERKPILMLNIDWMKLEEWNLQRPAGQRLFDPNDTSDGGLVIFLSVKGPKSRGANNYGVRVYNAQRLRWSGTEAGVTFASDVAFYVAGNFNCRDPDEGVLESADPMPCGTNGKRPAAIVADTINVLSCAWVEVGAGDPWDDAGLCRGSFPAGEAAPGWQPHRPLDERSTQGTGTDAPAARRTVINAAFLAGNDVTWCPGNPGGIDCGYSWYSGGLENYPRFHECWAACNTGGNAWNGRLWYEGSMVALEAPRHTCFSRIVGLTTQEDSDYPCRTAADRVTGSNGTAPRGFWSVQRYSPPQRRWFYDVSFNDARNLPPLSPRFVSLKLRWFTEEFR